MVRSFGRSVAGRRRAIVPARAPGGAAGGPIIASLRWRIAFIISLAIAISYLDRQALSIAVAAIQREDDRKH
jgi:hypothetical protein